MFESLVTSLLNTYLGAFVEGISRDQLKLSVWSGNVDLKDLKVKASALSFLRLPVDVKAGSIGRLTLKANWARLGSEPVQAELHDVYVLAGPRTDYEYDAEAELHAHVQAKLDELRLAQEEALASTAARNKADEDGGGVDLGTKILNNLQLSIRRIHVRYEDDTAAGTPLAFGVCLRELSALTVDKDGRPAYVEADVMYKRVRLGDFFVYLNDDPQTARRITSVAGLSEMLEEGDEARRRLRTKYVLHPVNGSMRVVMRKRREESPNVEAVGELLLFHLSLEEEQYQSLLWAVNRISAAQGRFAEIAERTKPTYRAATRKDRSRYLELYKRTLNTPWLKPLGKAEADELESLDREVETESVAVWRWTAVEIVHRELKGKEVTLRKAKAGVFSRLFGGGGGGGGGGKPDVQLTPEQEEAIAEAINGKSEQDRRRLLGELPEGHVVFRAAVTLREFRTSLFLAGGRPLFHFRALESGVEAVTRPTSVSAAVRLGSVLVEDLFTPGTKYPRLICTEGAASDLSARGQGGGGGGGGVGGVGVHEPLLRLEYDANPLGSEADTRVLLVVRRLDVVANQVLMARVGEFFQPRHALDLDALEAWGAETVGRLMESTRASVMQSMNEHLALDLSVDLQAPRVVVLEDPCSEAPGANALVADLGRVAVRSVLHPAARVREFDGEVQRLLTLEGAGKYGEARDALHPGTAALGFDSYVVELKGAQVYATRGRWSAALATPGLAEGRHLVEPVTVTGTAMVCIQGAVLVLPSTALLLDVQDIRVNASPLLLRRALSVVAAMNARAAGGGGDGAAGGAVAVLPAALASVEEEKRDGNAAAAAAAAAAEAGDDEEEQGTGNLILDGYYAEQHRQVTRLFARLLAQDADGSGTLSFEELKPALGEETARSMMKEVDADGDGELSLAEVRAWYDKRVRHVKHNVQLVATVRLHSLALVLRTDSDAVRSEEPDAEAAAAGGGGGDGGDDDDNNDELFAVVLTRSVIRHRKRAFEMDTHMDLGSFQVRDRHQPYGAATACILTTTDAATSAADPASSRGAGGELLTCDATIAELSDLMTCALGRSEAERTGFVHVYHHGVSLESPDLADAPAVMSLDASVGDLTLVVEPSRVLALVRLALGRILPEVDEGLVTEHEQPPQGALAESASSPADLAAVPAQSAAPGSGAPRKSLAMMRVAASVDSVRVRLISKQSPVAEFSASAARLRFVQYRLSMDASAELGGLELRDLTPAGTGFPVVLHGSGGGEPTAAAEASTFHPAEADFPGHAGSLTARLRDMEAIFLNRFAQELLLFVTEGPLAAAVSELQGRAAVSAAPPLPAQQPPPPPPPPPPSGFEPGRDFFLLDVRADRLCLTVPRDSFSDRYARASVEGMCLTSALEGGADGVPPHGTYEAEVRSVSARVVQQHATDKYPLVSLGPLRARADLVTHDDLTRVEADLGVARLGLSQEHYWFLLTLMAGNLGEGPSVLRRAPEPRDDEGGAFAALHEHHHNVVTSVSGDHRHIAPPPPESASSGSLPSPPSSSSAATGRVSARVSMRALEIEMLERAPGATGLQSTTEWAGQVPDGTSPMVLLRAADVAVAYDAGRGGMKADAHLADVMLSDVTPGSGLKFRQVLTLPRSSNEDAPWGLQVRAAQAPHAYGDDLPPPVEVAVDLSEGRITVAPVLVKLAGFFSAPPPVEECGDAAAPASSASAAASSPSRKRLAPGAVHPDTVAPASTPVRVRVRLPNPKVMLLRDPKLDESSALVLTYSVDAVVNVRADGSVAVGADLDSLQMFQADVSAEDHNRSAAIAVAAHEASASARELKSLLDPMSARLVLQSHRSSLLHGTDASTVALDVDPVFLWFTYRDYRLITDSVESMQMYAVAEDGEQVTTAAAGARPAAATKPRRPDAPPAVTARDGDVLFDYLFGDAGGGDGGDGGDDDGAGGGGGSGGTGSRAPAGFGDTHVSVRLRGLQATLLNDVGDAEVPLVRLNVSGTVFAAAEEDGVHEEEKANGGGKSIVNEYSSVVSSAPRIDLAARSGLDMMEEVEGAVSLRLYAFGGRQTVATSVSFQTDYYNSRIIQWEPLTEPWTVVARVVQSVTEPAPDEVGAAALDGGGPRRADDRLARDAGQTSTRLTVRAPGNLNVNVTSSLVSGVVDAYKLVAREEAREVREAAMRQAGHQVPARRRAAAAAGAGAGAAAAADEADLLLTEDSPGEASWAAQAGGEGSLAAPMSRVADSAAAGRRAGSAATAGDHVGFCSYMISNTTEYSVRAIQGIHTRGALFTTRRHVDVPPRSEAPFELMTDMYDLESQVVSVLFFERGDGAAVPRPLFKPVRFDMALVGAHHFHLVAPGRPGPHLVGDLAARAGRKYLELHSMFGVRNLTTHPLDVLLVGHDGDDATRAVPVGGTCWMPLSPSPPLRALSLRPGASHKWSPPVEVDYDRMEAPQGWLRPRCDVLDEAGAAAEGRNHPFHYSVEARARPETGDTVYVVEPPVVVENLLASDAVVRMANSGDRNDTAVPRTATAHFYALDLGMPVNLQVALDGLAAGGAARWSEEVCLPPGAELVVPHSRRAELAPRKDDSRVDWFPRGGHDPKSRTKNVARFAVADSRGEELCLHAEVVFRGSMARALGPVRVTLFCPYWVFDATGLGLALSRDGKSFVARNEATLDEASAAGLGGGLCRASMFNFSRDFRGSAKDRTVRLSARGGAGEWSEPFNPDLAGMSGAFSVRDAPAGAGGGGPSRLLEVGLSISALGGRFVRTKALLLSSRYVLHNSLPYPVEVRQKGCARVIRVAGLSQASLHWPDAERPRLVSFRVPAWRGWDWSGHFAVDNVSELALRLRRADGGAAADEPHRYARAEVRASASGAGVFVVLGEYRRDMLPHRVENRSPSETVRFRQTGLPDDAEWVTLPPFTFSAYALEEPLGERTVDVEVVGTGYRKAFAIDGVDEVAEVARLPAAKGRRARELHLFTDNDGPVQVLAAANHSNANTAESTKERRAVLKRQYRETDGLVGDLYEDLYAESGPPAARAAPAPAAAAAAAAPAAPAPARARPGSVPGGRAALLATVAEARGLGAKETYCVLMFGAEKRQSPAVRRTDSPKIGFKAQFDATGADPRAELVVLVMEQNTLWADNALGEVRVPLTPTLARHEPVERWFRVGRAADTKAEPQGEVRLALWWVPVLADAAATAALTLRQHLRAKTRLIAFAERQLAALAAELGVPGADTHKHRRNFRRRLRDGTAGAAAAGAAAASPARSPSKRRPSGAEQQEERFFEVEAEILAGRGINDAVLRSLSEADRAGEENPLRGRVFCALSRGSRRSAFAVGATDGSEYCRSGTGAVLLYENGFSALEQHSHTFRFRVSERDLQGDPDGQQNVVIALFFEREPQVQPPSMLRRGGAGDADGVATAAASDAGTVSVPLGTVVIPVANVAETAAPPDADLGGGGGGEDDGDEERSFWQRLRGNKAAERAEREAREAWQSQRQWLSLEHLVKREREVHEAVPGSMQICVRMRRYLAPALEDEATANVTVALPHVGVSIVDKRPREVLYLSARGMHLSVSQTAAARSVELVVDDVHADDQERDAPFEVVFAPAPAPDDEPSRPFVHLAFNQSLAAGRGTGTAYLQDAEAVKEMARAVSSPGGSLGPPVPPAAAAAAPAHASPHARGGAGPADEAADDDPAALAVASASSSSSSSSSSSPPFPDEAHGMGSQTVTFPYFSLLVQAMVVRVTEERLWKYLDMLGEVGIDGGGLDYRTEAERLRDVGRAEEGAAADAVALSAASLYCVPPSSGTLYYFKVLQLHPVAAAVTFKGSGYNRYESGDSFSFSPLAVLLRFAVTTVGNLDKLPVRLNGLTIPDASGPAEVLQDAVAQHYTTQAMRQWHRVLGSLDLLGNPLFMMTSLGTGVLDFFYEPAKGLVRSPAAFGRGVAKGSASLIGNTMSGVLGGASNVTRVLGRQVALLSMDENYIRQHEAKQQEEPTNLASGLVGGFKSFGKGLAKGISGVVVDPVKGAKRGGAKGFFKGVGTGLLGVVAKPTAGAVDLASQTLQGLGNTPGYLLGTGVERLERVRPPRYIPPHTLYLRPYVRAEALGQELVESTPMRADDRTRVPPRAAAREHFLFLVSPSDRAVLVVSDLRLVLKRVLAEGRSRAVADARRFLRSKFRRDTVWQVLARDVTGAGSRGSSVVLHVSGQKSDTLEMPCASPAEAEEAAERLREYLDVAGAKE